MQIIPCTHHWPVSDEFMAFGVALASGGLVAIQLHGRRVALHLYFSITAASQRADSVAGATLQPRPLGEWWTYCQRFGLDMVLEVPGWPWLLRDAGAAAPGHRLQTVPLVPRK
jgi:hypothetical protein